VRAESVHLDLRRIGHAGSVLVVVGDAAGDGPAAELLAELGPGQVRVLPGVGRVQAACAALGLSPDVVSVVDLRRSPLAALRGQLRAHRLFAVPLADAAAPVAVARLLVDSGFAGARVWVCEFAGGELQARAWLATELAELRELRAAGGADCRHRPVGGPVCRAAGHRPGEPGRRGPRRAAAGGAPAGAGLAAARRLGNRLGDLRRRSQPGPRMGAGGADGAPARGGRRPQPAGGGDGPGWRRREPAAIPAASPLRCREWPAPEAVFVRGGVGLSEWLAAAWARLAPGGRLVATAEDDNARADLLAFAAEVPAEAWQELALASGETVAGRLRFAPAAPVRLALWRKPLET
jgi:precorrin-6Y C5,15-methyltransferase (decarboxylating)